MKNGQVQTGVNANFNNKHLYLEVRKMLSPYQCKRSNPTVKHY